jgi:hypothetical protein
MSNPKWMNQFEIILLAITAIVSGLVSLLDMFGLLDSITWLSGRIPSLTLLMSGIIATYLVLERKNQLNELQKENRQGFQNIESLLEGSRASIIDSLKGVDIQHFKSGNELMQYINKRLGQAKQQIDDLSWSSTISLSGGLNATQELNREFAEKTSNIANKITYREVFVFNRPGRKEKLQTRLAENRAGYSCVFYEKLEVPVLQFMIIDREEVIFLTDEFETKLSVRQPQIVKLFIEYYEAIWKQAKPIKTGVLVHQETINSILGKT